MLPVVLPDSHKDFQDFFVPLFLLYYPDPFTLSKQTWQAIVQFWNLDLSQTDAILADTYSKYGPAPRTPSCMLRSYLLSLKLKFTSITAWVCELKTNPLYAILSGFTPGDVPGVGTFYVFLSRIWKSDSNNFSPKECYKKKKTPKGKKHGDKTLNIKSSAAFRFIEFFKKHPLSGPQGSPLELIFRLYKEQFLDRSVQSGLINKDCLSLAGDGTPVRTQAKLRYKKTCSCGQARCSCKRLFSQPDCNCGWDSSRDCYFNGYHLYMYVAADSENDLPVFPLLERASRHDMLSFLHSFFTMKAWLPEFRAARLLLDAAHDADAVYRYCLQENIIPFIDLNEGNLGNYIYKDTFYLDKDGTPICTKTAKKFRRDGYEPGRKRFKWRCPLADKNGCHCETPCSKSAYGRTVHTRPSDDPRLVNNPPRGSEEWEKEYAKRTSVERSNKREKEDYKLEDGRHRSTKMWYCRLYGIIMLQHLDAWEMPSIEAFQESMFGHAA